MSYDELIDRLAADLTPVRPRRAARDALGIGGLGLLELVLFLAVGMARPNMPLEMTHASLWWRLGSLGAITLIAGAAAIRSFDPARSPRAGLRWTFGLAIICLALGSGIEGLRNGSETIIQQLDWTQGVQCAGKITLLSIPPLVSLGVMMRHGAPADTSRTALLVGLAAAAWGAFVFVFACPFNNPFYVMVWYGIGFAIVTLLARLILVRLARW